LRFKRHTKMEYCLTPMDIAPLIDMVLLLLIFFLLTSSFIFQKGIKINLPKTISSEVAQDGRVITITRDNAIRLDGKAITLSELEKALKTAARENAPLLIKADRRASLGRVGDVWDLCREIGLTRVNIATNSGQ
jgi:biopolymer transport protein ExbD